MAHQAAVGAETHVVGLDVTVEHMEAGHSLAVDVAQGLRQLDAALQRALQRPLLDAASPHPERRLRRLAGLDGAAARTP